MTENRRAYSVDLAENHDNSQTPDRGELNNNCYGSAPKVEYRREKAKRTNQS